MWRGLMLIGFGLHLRATSAMREHTLRSFSSLLPKSIRHRCEPLAHALEYGASWMWGSVLHSVQRIRLTREAARRPW